MARHASLGAAVLTALLFLSLSLLSTAFAPMSVFQRRFDQEHFGRRRLPCSLSGQLSMMTEGGGGPEGNKKEETWADQIVKNRGVGSEAGGSKREGKKEDSPDLVTYVFGKPGEFDRDLAAMGTSRRRFFGLQFVALLFALGGNFLGVTSFLLGLLPGLDGLYKIPAELTLFYPVKGWKRYVGEGGYEFIYPSKWLQDQAVTFANTKGPEDQAMISMRTRKTPAVTTSVAFGPPMGDSSENVSVVKSRLRKGFTLRALGEPEAAAQRLLDTAIAPPASGKVSRLISAVSEMRGDAEVYQFEYVVTLKDGRTLHNVCACCTRDDVLYTLTVLAPEEQWPTDAEKLAQVAKSFRLI